MTVSVDMNQRNCVHSKLKNMADVTMCMLLKFTCLVFVMSTAHSLDLNPPGSTRRPRVTKFSKTTLPPGPTEAVTERSLSAATYRLTGNAGTTCVLMTVDALIAISYTTKLQERVETDLYVPNNAKVTGSCKDEDAETIMLSFKEFTMQWAFAKTPGGERWYVESIRLWYNSSVPLIQHGLIRGARVSLGTPERALLFATPVGKSFVCNKEITVDLNNIDPNSNIDHTAKLFLREFKLQAFMYKDDGEFGTPWECSLSGRTRSETAPVAVGAALALATAGTLVGYAVWRYIKVKKVQYDTME